MTDFRCPLIMLTDRHNSSGSQFEFVVAIVRKVIYVRETVLFMGDSAMQMNE